MQNLISPQEAAKQIGVSVHTIKVWMRRAEDPLPSVQVGESGKFLKVIASEIEPWLTAEASRKVSATSRGSR
jgi:transposase